MNEVTNKVYRYLCESFGKKILMAQQETPSRFDPEDEMTWIMEHTGKLPAIRALDYINRDFEGVNRRAVRWWRMGGLVSICWHVGIFDGGYPDSQNDVPDFEKLLTPGTDEHIRMLNNWDVAAFYLRQLRDAGVPVIWRPFHEFDGKWFWWGKGEGENFIRLWRLMHDRFTRYFKLDNLIWLLGYADDVKDGWYPGDEYVDLIGSDTYRPGPEGASGNTHKTAWQRLEQMNTGNMPFIFHECGTNMPEIDDFWQDGCPWLWVMPWHSKWLKENDPEKIRRAYHHENSITLDKLPSFRQQEINTMKIETARTVITQFDLSMAEAVHLNSLDEDNRRFVPDEVFETVEDARETIEFLISVYETGDGPLVYPVLLKDGTNVGYVQLVPMDDGFEVGYHIGKAYTNHGYATEALTAFLQKILPQKQLDSVWGICVAENKASIRVLEKCGFRKQFDGIGAYQGEERPIVKYLFTRA